jgi:hypothetical protein
MSLDVYLNISTPIKKQASSGIFIRENGATKEISQKEWNERFPNQTAYVVQSEDSETTQVYSANITHNLGAMAKACGIYDAVWYPELCGITKASQLIEPLQLAIAKLKANPSHFKQYNPKNNWGNYDAFVSFLEGYLQACIETPSAEISVCC